MALPRSLPRGDIRKDHPVNALHCEWKGVHMLNRAILIALSPFCVLAATQEDAILHQLWSQLEHAEKLAEAKDAQAIPASKTSNIACRSRTESRSLATISSPGRSVPRSICCSP
jgi:hypothetical protein